MSPAATSAKSAGPFSAPLIVRRAAAVPLRPRGFPSSPAREHPDGRPQGLDDTHDDGDRSPELERAAPPRVRDQAGGGLAKSLVVAPRANMDEDAPGGDRE